jgi:hypothetical protein
MPESDVSGSLKLYGRFLEVIPTCVKNENDTGLGSKFDYGNSLVKKMTEKQAIDKLRWGW